MFSPTIENTTIWKNAFNSISNLSENEILLKSSFIESRKKVSQLVNRITADFRDLTIHDITHLDKLWEMADFLLNDEFQLNPLEVYILGISILLHDSGLTFSAYNSDMQSIRHDIFWRDTVAKLQFEHSDKTEEEISKISDFLTIRKLHASQAEILSTMSWSTPDGQELYLIDDFNLRNSIGKLCGEIAASHHLDIEEVEFKFGEKINPPSFLPKEWSINPLQIAILLRCADAAHITSDRAPNFTYTLLKPTGTSGNHWKFQNRVSHPGYHSTEKHKLVYNSTQEFLENDRDAWWLLYDSLIVLNKEIINSNRVLLNNGYSTIFATGVKDIEEPEKISKYIKAKDWTPKNIAIHISNVEKMIRNFGGDKLYGTKDNEGKIGIVIRELIQNARDAIKTRESIDDNFTDGKIQIEIEKDGEHDMLIINDNGIGMSERVLFDVLLDFGNSIWSNDIIKSEFPGLLNKNFDSIGQFGIGFYSVFMIADQIHLTTRQWNKGTQDTTELIFSEQNILRPLLKKNQTELSSAISTEIKIKLKADILNENLFINVKPNHTRQTSYDVPIANYISAISLGLDCDVYMNNNLIHSDISKNFDIEKWLIDSTYCEYNPNIDLNATKKTISEISSKMERIYSGEKLIGLGYFYFGSVEILNASHNTIGGLQSTFNNNQSHNYFIGFINHLPETISRNHQNVINSPYQADFRNFIDSQVEKLKEDALLLDEHRRNFFGNFLRGHNFPIFKDYINFLCHLDGNLYYISFNQLIPLFENYNFGLIAQNYYPFHEYHYDQRDELNFIPNIIYILPNFNQHFLSTKDEEFHKDNNFLFYLKQNYIVDVIYDNHILGNDRTGREDRELTTIILKNKGSI